MKSLFRHFQSSEPAVETVGDAHAFPGARLGRIVDRHKPAPRRPTLAPAPARAGFELGLSPLYGPSVYSSPLAEDAVSEDALVGSDQ